MHKRDVTILYSNSGFPFYNYHLYLAVLVNNSFQEFQVSLAMEAKKVSKMFGLTFFVNILQQYLHGKFHFSNIQGIPSYFMFDFFSLLFYPPTTRYSSLYINNTNLN